MIGENSYKTTIDTGAMASFVSEELADNLAALGRITRPRGQVMLADIRCLGMEVKFGNKKLTMSLLTFSGVVDTLVLGVGTKVKRTLEEIIIPAVFSSSLRS